MTKFVLSIVLCAVSVCAQNGASGVSGFSGISGFSAQQTFTLSASPSTIAVNAGSTATSTITVTSVGGFNSAVALTAAPGPPGVTYGFSPSSVTPAPNGSVTSTLTLTASAGAPASSCPGNGSFSITGTSGVIAPNITACTTVTPVAGGFTLSVATIGVGSVSSSPSGVACPGAGCFPTFSSGTSVTLTETPGGGQTFLGWSGACSGGASTCPLTISSALSVTASFTGTGASATLPQAWVDPEELLCKISGYTACYNGANGQSPALTVPYTAPAYELTLGSGSLTGGSVPGYCTITPASYAATGAGLQAAITAVELCRTAGIAHSAAVCGIIDMPPGNYLTSTGLVIPQTSATASTCGNVLRTTTEATLAALPQPPCAGGIQDNVATSTNIGLKNPDCTGGNVYYNLGQSGGNLATGWTTLSATTTTVTAITHNATAQEVPLANGYIGPGVAFTIDTAGNAETVTTVAQATGSATDGVYGVFTKDHAAGVAVSFCASGFCSSGYALANSNTVTKAGLNYQQYFARSACTSTAAACVPLQLCTPSVLGLTTPCASSGLGPDHWEFADMELDCSGNPGNNCVGFYAGSQSNQATNISQFAHNIHLRRIWAHGDWTSLYTGLSTVSDLLNFNGCYYCSAIDWQASQNLRPGAEGHALLGQGQVLRFEDYVIDCCSSGVFGGGLASTPAIPTFVPFTNIEKRRYLSSFPWSWLGFQAVPGSLNSSGNAFGQIPDANVYWGGAGDYFDKGTIGVTAPQCDGTAPNSTCVNVSAGGLVTYVSGPTFHGTNSFWKASNVPIKIFKNNSGNTCVSGGTCTDYYSYSVKASTISGTCPGSCPTTFNITATSVPALTNVPIILVSPSIVRKNSDETKEGQYVLDDAGINENVDQSGGQNGICKLAAARQTSGGAVGQNYYSQLSDFTVTNGICRHTCTGRSFAARSAGGGDGGGVSYAMTRFFLEDILDYDINKNNIGCGSATQGWAMSSIGQTWTGTISSSAGTATFTAVTALQALPAPGQPVAGAIGYQVLNIRTGESVAISNCDNPAFNTPTYSVGSHKVLSTGPYASTGSTPWSGTPAVGNYSVSYPWAVSGTETGGHCTLTNIQGGPSYMTVNHVLIAAATNSPLGLGPAFNNASGTAGANHQSNHIFTNSIIVGSLVSGTQLGWFNTIVGQGNATESYNYDTGTMTATYLVWPAVNAGTNCGVSTTCYTEFGNNPSYTDPSPTGCKGVGCTPPLTGTGQNWFFPTTAGCSSGVTSSCVGFSGMLSGLGMNFNLANYHGYGLNSASIFHSTAQDGTDYGPRITNIDAAQTNSGVYVCATPCGTPGPFPE
jgi:hypothetical protein